MPSPNEADDTCGQLWHDWGILLINLICSGDNALVIGAVAAPFPQRQRVLMLGFGSGCTLLLRILFTIAATWLLRISLLQVGRAGMVFALAIKLLRDRGQRAAKAGKQARGNAAYQPAHSSAKHQHWGSGMAMLVGADLFMSLDNILAVGALAAGNVLAIAIGLGVSSVILLAVSAFVAEVVTRVSWLLDLASVVLAWTAAKMVLSDALLQPRLEQAAPLTIHVAALGTVSVIDLMLYGVVLAMVLLVDLVLRLHNHRLTVSS